jgi:prepilin-type N-terminal cleavage/methylation domain-containing protein
VNRAFTLIEMLIAILLTAIVFTYLYATLNNVRANHGRYEKAVEGVSDAERIFSMLQADLTQSRDAPQIVHEAGFDRFSVTTAHSVYGIARPWVHYYISRKDLALIRVEADRPIDFSRSGYIGDINGTYLFVDRLAEGCSSLRISTNGSKLDLLLRCRQIPPIVISLYKGDR